MSNLIKLHQALKHNEASTEADRHPFWKLFEIIVAVYIEELFGIIVFLWSDVPIAIRDKLGLPKQDTGVDFITEDLRVMGQAKYYTTGQIGSGDMSRTRLCAYIASENDNDTKLVLVGSTDVKISSVSSKRDGFKCVQINNTDDLNKFYSDKQKISYAQHILTTAQIDAIIERAKNVVIPVSVTQSIATLPLRQCQLDAMAAIKKEGITRLNMACASGKSKMIMSHIIKPGNGFSHLILVPSVMLMEQWNDLVKEYICAYSELNINLISIGTGHNDKFDDRLANAGFDFDIYVCVYNSYSYVEKMTFDTVTIDEAHHIDKKSFETETYLSKIASIKNAIYLSASFPKREIDYKYPIRQAINDGILTDYDIIIPYSNDLNVNIDNMLIKYFLQHSEFLSILVYFNRISEIEAFVKMCKMNNIKALSLSCEESITKRTEILDKLRSGEIRLIASVNTLGEGIDLKNVDVCCFARTRESEFSIIQCIGRILRKHPTKKMAHVILPVDTNNLEDIPIIAFLAKIAKFDDVYYKDFVQKKSNRISFVNMNEIKINIETRVEMDDIEELVLDKTCSIVSDTWMVKYQMLKVYYDLNKKFPKCKFVCENGFKLGIWFDIQKQKQRKDKLDINKVKMLDNINPDWKNKQRIINDWYHSYSFLKEYHNINKKFPEQRFICENGFKLGNWFSKQKMDRDQLDLNKIKLLDDIDPSWKNVQKIAKNEWGYMYTLIKKYYDMNKKTLPGQKEVYNEIKIGSWLNKQKQYISKLDADKIKMLDDIDPSWKHTLTDIWKEKCSMLKEYYDANQQTFPSGVTIYHEFSIGSWLNNQKNNIAKLDADKIKMLDDIDPSWKHTLTDIWKEKCSMLKEYYDANQQTFPSGVTIYHEFSIGSWLNNQKNNIAKLDADKIKMLDDIDPSWKHTLTDIWKEKCSMLKEYYDANQQTFPEIKTIYNNIKIGYWLSSQKSNIAKLSVEKIKLLDDINPKWKNTYTDIWKNNCAILREYYDNHSNTFPGSTISYNGIKIGSWFHDQKKNIDKLDAEKIKLLNDINPNWKNTLVDIWKEWCATLKEYYISHSNTFPTARIVYNGVKIGTWLFNQKNNITKLDDEKIKLLDNINPKWKNTFVDVWKDKCAILKEYYNSHSNTFPIAKTIYNGVKIGNWLFNQKGKIVKLSVEQIKLLDDINPNWKNKTAIDQLWTKNAELLTSYRELNKRLPTIDQDANLFQWIEDNKKLYLEDKLSEEQIVALNLIDVCILPDADPHIFQD